MNFYECKCGDVQEISEGNDVERYVCDKCQRMGCWKCDFCGTANGFHHSAECVDNEEANSSIGKELERGDKAFRDCATHLYRMGACRTEQEVNIFETETPYTVSVRIGKMQVSTEEILQKIYDSEIHLSIGWMWDGGIDYRIGADLSYIEKRPTSTGTDKIEQAVIIIANESAKEHPKSEFAKWWAENKV